MSQMTDFYTEQLKGVLEDAQGRLFARTNDRIYDDDVSVYSFPETWASTSLGFGGMGGSMITTAQTHIIVRRHHSEALIYWGGRFGKATSAWHAMECVQKRRTSSI